MKTKLISTTVLSALFFASCEKSETVAVAPAADPAFERFFTEKPLGDAQPIHVARTTAKPGDEITLEGQVMGRENVFVNDRAAFILGDPAKLTPCNEMPDDPCETPWDACCDSKELKREGTASIQLVDQDGRVLEGDIKGTSGLKELSSVTVTGTVAPQSTEDALIVNAARIHVSEP